MARASVLQSNFNGGEISPLLYGRVDLDKYKTSLATSLNGFGLVQGGWTRRPGTKFVHEVKDSADATRLVRFQFSTTQAYILEFGDLYFRIYKDRALIESGGSPVEVTTPYAAADIFQLKFVQSADVLYVAHPDYAPRKITRTSHTSWSISTITFIDGPYATTNSTSITLTPSATSGTGITLTASSALFSANDVGRLVRLKNGSNWGYARITAFTDTTHVTADNLNTFSDTSANVNWRLGIWSDNLGYPGTVTFFEDRLVWGGAPAAPDRFDGSVTGDYENMAPSDNDGTVNDDNAISFTLRSGDVQVIRWMADDEKGLEIGTVSGEWIVRPSSQGEAVTPTNINAKQSTSKGSADISPVRAGKAVLFVQRAGRKLREIAYVYEVDGFRSPDMTVLAEHITAGGLVEIAYQQEPQSIVWAVRNDGVLLSFLYDRDQNVLGWHRNILGGVGDADGGAPVVESVATIPAPDGTYDEVWLVVQRYIDGASVRYVEYMTKVRERGDDLEDTFCVDCGLTYDGSAATTISGLDHLEGETVQILADGAAHADCTVDGGEITLSRSAEVVQVGYSYNSDGQMLRPEAGAADGTSQGKTQRTHRVTFRLHDTGTLKVGKDFDNLDTIVFREAGDNAGEATPLYSGDKSFTWEGDYTTENYVCWRMDGPLPGTILAVMPQLVTQDR